MRATTAIAVILATSATSNAAEIVSVTINPTTLEVTTDDSAVCTWAWDTGLATFYVDCAPPNATAQQVAAFLIENDLSAPIGGPSPFEVFYQDTRELINLRLIVTALGVLIGLQLMQTIKEGAACSHFWGPRS